MENDLKNLEEKIQEQHHHIELKEPAPSYILLTIHEIPCLCNDKSKVLEYQNQQDVLSQVICTWYELYHFNEQKLQFEIKEKIELYIKKFNVDDSGTQHTYLLIPLFNNSDQQFYQVEMFQNGNIEKYNTQIKDCKQLRKYVDGIVVQVPAILNEEQKTYQQLASAFSHWTQLITGGMITIADVQGWRIGYTLNLTDPLIHSYKLAMFGEYDLGEYGQKTWLDNHDCKNNKFCQLLGLQANKKFDDEAVKIELKLIMNKFSDGYQVFQPQFQFMVTEIYNDDNFPEDQKKYEENYIKTQQIQIKSQFDEIYIKASSLKEQKE
ncbi:UNKNOWN [Stylonychia lemnae]|uniref:Alpha-type protein kinase domain-containing protein n=1 Tax=Stylonychia lemnae TaxID=5949 RepID=A0A078BAN0_STYLE|nr:UNKNOWN [Stylonychia lemnae]|eukprot:CDW91409.1 UNKNOWN [Stylonychia lemnae]